MSDRRGDWIQTYTGRPFWPLDPRPEDILIDDIAHALALKVRYSGHCRWPYSVAQHSVLVSRWITLQPQATPQEALWGLLHDAAEAYLADIPKPVKPFLEGWKDIEASMMRVICARFGLPEEEPEIVREADFRILTDEREQIMNEGPSWSRLGHPLGLKIRRMTWFDAKTHFLNQFRVLTS